MPHGSSQWLIFHPLSEERIMSTALRKKMHHALRASKIKGRKVTVRRERPQK
jgi:hypothetical protein